MIPTKIYEWLRGDESYAPTTQKVFKLKINNRFDAIYVQEYRPEARYFKSLFEVRFLALWDSELQAYRTWMDTQDDREIESLNLGSRDNVKYLPSKLGSATGMVRCVSSMLEECIEHSYEVIESKAHMTKEECRDGRKIEIEKMARRTILETKGVHTDKIQRWKYGKNRISETSYQYLLNHWSEDMLLDLLEDKKTIPDIAKEYFEAEEEKIYQDILLQKLVDDRVEELNRFNIGWIQRKVEILNVLKEFEEQGRANVWIQYVDIDSIRSRLKGRIDEMMLDLDSPTFIVDGKKIDVLSIVKLEWSRKIYWQVSPNQTR